MSPSILIALVFAAAAINALRGDGLITSRPYNNPYNDASAARDERAAMLS